MADFKSMYKRLFNRVSDAITLLQSAQAETEEMYLSQDEPDIVLLDNSEDE